MIYTSDTMTATVEVMMERYRQQLGLDPELLLMDQDSYEILREEILGPPLSLGLMELDVYKGMRVFRSDIQHTYILVL